MWIPNPMTQDPHLPLHPRRHANLSRQNPARGWRAGRNFALGEQAGKVLLPIFTDYYRRVQNPRDDAGCARCRRTSQEINVSADTAALQVRKIIRNMVADETGTEFRRTSTTRSRMARTH